MFADCFMCGHLDGAIYDFRVFVLYPRNVTSHETEEEKRTTNIQQQTGGAGKHDIETE